MEDRVPTEPGSRHVRFPVHDLETVRIIKDQNTEPTDSPGKDTDTTNTYIKINATPPNSGITTTFLVEVVSAKLHQDTEEIMYATQPGKMAHDANTMLVNKILNDMGHSPSSEKYKLLCVSKSNTSESTMNGVDMVFALVGGAKTQNTQQHELRCILYAKTSANGERFIRTIKLPTATCQLEYMTSYETYTPNKTWLSLLHSLKIADTNTNKASFMCENELEKYRKKNSDKPVSYCIIPTHRSTRDKGVCEEVSLGANGTINDLNIQFTRDGSKHVVHVDACALDLLSTDIKGKHRIMVSDVQSTPPTMYEIPTKNTTFVLAITMPYATRVKCALMEKSASGGVTYVASTDVNFCNNMIYTDMRAKGVEDVFGVQRIALRISNRLQENLTPVMIAQRLNTGHYETKNLMRLMSSTDLLTDLKYVIQYQTIKDPKARNVTANTNARLFESINYVQQSTAQQLKTNQDSVFATCSAFKHTRVTASISAERARWQDHHPDIASSDGLLRQKMTSARGVAVLSIRNQTNTRAEKKDTTEIAGPTSDKKKGLGIHKECTLGTYVLFSSSNIPRLVLRDETVTVKKTPMYTTSRPLDWTDTPQFVYNYCKFSKALQVIHGSNPIALFEAPQPTPIKYPHQERPSVPISTAAGSLVRELLDLSTNSKSVYTRALAHRVITGAVDNCGLLKTHIKPQTQTMSWLNHYRNQFLNDRCSKNKNIVGVELDQLYIDYSIFSQCLKDQAIGSKIPADMFALLVNTGIPFPNT